MSGEFSDEKTKHDLEKHSSKLFVKDRIGNECWQQLLNAVKGKDIPPPTISKKRKLRRMMSSYCSPKKRDRDVLNTLYFPATSSHSSFHVDTSNSSMHQTISEDNLLSLFDSVLKKTRQATSSDGKAHFLVEEVKDNLTKALESSRQKTRNVLKNEVPIQGISEDNFTAEEIASMPLVFAYYCQEDDPKLESEQNAKIATLDYEVEQRRSRRNAASLLKSPEAAKEMKPHSPESAENQVREFPIGWTKQVVARQVTNTKADDTYYYSPKGFKFRSRPEVRRFLELLATCKDEETAFAKFRSKS